MTATFFGHRDCPDTILPSLRTCVRTLVEQHGVEIFYVGNQGQFDRLVCKVLSELQKEYPTLTCCMVLAYVPCGWYDVPLNLVIPDGLETVPRRLAISYRNQWMLRRAQVVVTYLRHSGGGAAKFAALAEKNQKHLVAL